MIAIFFALSREVASLKPQVNVLKKIRHGHAVFYQSEYCGFPVTLAQTGIGENVSDAVRYLSRSFSLQLIISSGFAGSVNPTVGVGDLIIGKRILHSSWEFSEGEILIDSTLSCDTSMVNLAAMVGRASDALKTHCGDILSVNAVVRQASEKKRLGDNTSALAVDMESFTLAEQAYSLGIPFVAARAISDGAEEDMEIEENMVTEGGNVSVSDTARYLLSNPHHIPSLNRLRKQTKSAVDTLSAFLPNFITQIYNSLLT